MINILSYNHKALTCKGKTLLCHPPAEEKSVSHLYTRCVRKQMRRATELENGSF
jgi:hypothetical protein